MVFNKQISDSGYIASVSTSTKGVGNITETEYDEIITAIRNRPTPMNGYGYRLKTDLTWELYELPAVEEDEDPELTAEEALTIITEGENA